MVSKHVERTLSDTVTPQGVVSVARLPETRLDDVTEGSGFVLVLDEVRDPGNAGTLLRSALAAGADAVIFTSGSVDPFGPKTVRAAAGATFRISVVTDAQFDDVSRRLRSLGYSLVGTSAQGAQTIFDIDLTAPTAIVLGNESRGLDEAHVTALDTVASIPMPGAAESLNVGVAGSLVLFEVVRQRRVSSSTS
jgi:TrmH family RNA methyltransferase